MKPKTLLLIFLACIGLGAMASGPAAAQCIFSNPSFEIGGTGGLVFGGWNQFGSVGQVGDAVHGAKAALVTGPNAGGWDVSGYWQAMDCAVGEQWDVSGHVRHPSTEPLTGQSIALVNVEWRDAGGGLIDYDSFTVANAASATDEFFAFSVQSAPAPAGTVEARLLIGVLQSPTDPTPDVHYDQISFFSTTPPTIDDVQWNDFPGAGTLEFGGRTWRVKGPGTFGPGVNFFSNAVSAVWVDAEDRLHMTLKNLGWTWACTEVVIDEALGYGDYILTTLGPIHEIDPQAVLGIFLWEYSTCWDDSYTWWNSYNEIDIEYSRWCAPANSIAQFVAQPYNYPGNINRFDAAFGADEVVSHAMRWLPDRVEYRVWRGGPMDEAISPVVNTWTYTGPHIPRPEQPRMHLNLWKLAGVPVANQEIIFSNFVFIPEGATTDVDIIPGGGSHATASGRLLPAAPNPFNPRTAISYLLDFSGDVSVAIFDIMGRRVCTLASGHHDAGLHGVSWDGTDERGTKMGSGVYMVRLQGGGFMESRRLVLAK